MRKVSIIIPVYNGKKIFIKEAIDSALNQSYSNIEIIVVDDGSEYDIQKFLDVYTKNYKLIKVIHKKNEGVSVARNIGILNATGDFLFFLDSDDRLEKNTIEKLMKVQKVCNSDITGCLYYTFNKTLKKSLYKGPTMQTYNAKTLDYYRELMFTPTLKGNIQYPYCMCVWGKIFKKEIIVENHIYFDRELSLSEDLLYLNQLSYYINKMVIISDELYGYRLFEQSTTRKFDPDYVKKIVNMLTILEKKTNLTKDCIKSAFYIYRLLYLINIIKYYYADKQNNLHYFTKRKELKKLCDMFDIHKITISPSLSLKYKLYLYILKYKMVDIAYFLAFLSLHLR